MREGRGRASPMGRVTDAGSELAAVLWSGSEQDGGRGGWDLGVRAQGRGRRRGRSDGEAVGMRHVVQMERGVEDALGARHRDHEHESERERAPPHDDERQQGKRARREGERRGRRVVREDGAIGGAGWTEGATTRWGRGRGPVAGCHGCAQAAPGRGASRSATHTTTTSPGRRLTGAISSSRRYGPHRLSLHHARHPSLTAAPARAHLLRALAALVPVPARRARAPIAR